MKQSRAIATLCKRTHQRTTRFFCLANISVFSHSLCAVNSHSPREQFVRCNLRLICSRKRIDMPPIRSRHYRQCETTHKLNESTSIDHSNNVEFVRIDIRTTYVLCSISTTLRKLHQNFVRFGELSRTSV